MIVVNEAPIKIQIALQGGGAKLAALVAALEPLQKMEADKAIQVTRIAGTSAGAILAVLYAAKVPMGTVRDKLETLNAKSLLKFKTGKFAVPLSMYRGESLASIDPLREVLNELISNKHECEAEVLERLDHLDVPVHLVASDLQSASKLIYSSEKKSPILNSVINSCAIPFVFRSHGDSNGCTVDGGLCDNLPSDELQEHVSEDGPILGFSFKVRERSAPQNFKDYSLSLIDTAINNSMNRAKASLFSGGNDIHVIDTHIETLEFDKAFDKKTSDHLNLVSSKARTFLVDYIKRHRERIAESEGVSEEVLRRDLWVEAKSNDWAREHLKSMEILGEIYTDQHHGHKFPYLETCLYVKSTPTSDVLRHYGVYSPSDSAIYCQSRKLSILDDDHMTRLQKNQVYVDDLGSNPVKIKTKSLPMVTEGANPNKFRELLINFLPPLDPSSGPYKVELLTTIEGFLRPLYEEGKDELIINPRRSSSDIPEVKILLELDDTYRSVEMRAKQNARDPGRPMTSAELSPYERSCDPGRFVLGWIAENVSAEFDFGVDLINTEFSR